MAGFTESGFAKKLMDLNPSKDSIQTLSLYMVHYRRHHSVIVKVWYEEMFKETDNRKLTYMYLANDVIQNSKRKGPEFGKEFLTVLPKTFEHMNSCDENTRDRLNRLLTVWEERGVYNKALITQFKAAFGAATEPTEEHEAPPSKRARIEVDEEKEAKISRVTVTMPERKERKKSETEVEIDATRDLDGTLSPKKPAGNPPETEGLIKALMDLENTASSDASVRERIASLLPEVSEASLLANLADRAAADRLNIAVNEAATLLADYNRRLQAEMEDRRKLLTMLREYTAAQRQLLQQTQTSLEE